MHPRSTWSLVMVALGLFAFILFFERNRNLLPPPPESLLPSLSLPAVASVQIRPGDNAELIRVDRTNDTWLLTQPIVHPAEDLRVRALLQALSSLTRARQIANEQLRSHSDPQQEYGFKSPQFAITVEQAGNQPQQLLVGHTTRTGDEVFLQLVGSVGVFLADARLLQLLPRGKDDWRARALFPLSEMSFDRITVTNGPHAMALRWDGTNKQWQMIFPVASRADSARIDKLLGDLLGLGVTQFVSDDTNANLAAYGLRPAALELAFTQGTNALFAIAVGNSPSNDTSKVYVRRRDPAGVVLVAREPLEFWKLNHETFREHRLVNLAEEPLVRIEVKGESAFTLERQSNQTWRVTSPESLPADTGLVRAFLGLLNGLRITKFEREFQDPALAKEFGFAPPTRSVTLFRSDTNAPEGRRVLVQLDFGAESEDRELIYVRSADESSDRPLEDSPVYSIPRAAYQKLPTGGWQLRDRAIWRFTTNDVTRIIVRHEDKVMEVIREANGKWGLGPGTTGATNHFNSLGVDYLLDRLGRLDACTMDKVGQPNSDDLWLDRGPEASSRIGFTEKSLTVEVELRGESGNRTLKVALMPIPRTLYPLGATTLDGQTGIFVFPFDAFVMLNSLDPAPNPL